MILIDILALIGGCMLSVCLVPQIYKVYTTKEVENISYYWQALYLTGLIPHLIYGIYYDLIPIYVPTIIEIIFLIILIGLKYFYSSNSFIVET